MLSYIERMSPDEALLWLVALGGFGWLLAIAVVILIPHHRK